MVPLTAATRSETAFTDSKCSVRLVLLYFCSDAGQFCVDDFPQRLLGVVGDAHADFVAFNFYPFKIFREIESFRHFVCFNFYHDMNLLNIR